MFKAMVEGRENHRGLSPPQQIPKEHMMSSGFPVVAVSLGCLGKVVGTRFLHSKVTGVSFPLSYLEENSLI